MRTRLATPWFRPCLSNPAILLLGLIGVPEGGVAGTGRLVSSWMSRAPAIDGTIDPAEWAEATEVDFGGGSYLRIGNDGRTLYLAVRHNSYPFSHFLDTMILFFDDEGGAAPQLDDGVWSNPACHSDPELGEGEIWFEHSISGRCGTSSGSIRAAPRASAWIRRSLLAWRSPRPRAS